MAKFIGARSRSKEGPRHVTGRGLFTDDFMLPGMLQAMILVILAREHVPTRSEAATFAKNGSPTLYQLADQL